VRVVTLVGTPDRRDGTWLRVTQFGAWTADVGSVAELERFFPLSDLEPDDGRLVAGARLGGRRALVGERGPGDMAPPSAASRYALRPTTWALAPRDQIPSHALPAHWCIQIRVIEGCEADHGRPTGR
jgi:hypothetical protein